MKQLNEIYGNAAQPLGGGPRIIAHVVNDIGVWGAGFTSGRSGSTCEFCGQPGSLNSDRWWVKTTCESCP